MRRKGCKGRKPAAANDDMVTPTIEQMNRASFILDDTVERRGAGSITIGKAYQRRPMVDILAGQGLFSDAEYKALRAYRHYASLADRSLLRDSLNTQRGAGRSDGPTVEMLTAIQLTTACERAAGSLANILRAVVVEDISLSQWAINHGGSVEYCRDRKGKRVCSIEPRQKALRIAKLEIQIAAKRVEAEMVA